MGDDHGAGAGTPLPTYRYVEIADDIQARIHRGELPLGARLPGEQDLADEYSVATHTARRAVRLLRERGLVATLPSKGTYVVARPPEQGSSDTPPD